MKKKLRIENAIHYQNNFIQNKTKRLNKNELLAEHGTDFAIKILLNSEKNKNNMSLADRFVARLTFFVYSLLLF